MITPSHGFLGENVKVHFAGSENCEFAYVLHDAGVNYFLFTVLPFIADQFGVERGGFTNSRHLKAIEELPKIGNHVIMDSGLFSLMFGACKDVKPDKAFIHRWKDAIVDYVKANHADNVTCVECDCQKLLGPEYAWQLRTEMRKQLPNNRIINVFHFEDGKQGLDRLIDFSDYIAISVPELRIVKPKTYADDVTALAHYIKNRKPNIDIHLLGCTQKNILEKCTFCTSADSTSWQQVNRYGRILGHRTAEIKEDKVREGWQNIQGLLLKLGIEPTEKRIYYYYWLAGHLLKMQYAGWCGSQE